MALDARSRSSIYEKLIPVLGEDDANTLMSEFPSVEADELVTRQHLRAELAELRLELRTEISELRTEMSDRFRQQTTLLGSGLAGATALLAVLTTLT